MKQPVLVTGASGFIGGALVSYLRGRGITTVLSVDRRRPSGPLSKGFARLDVSRTKTLSRFLDQKRPRTIFHLAGGRFPEPDVMFAANVVTTLNLFAAIRRVKDYHPRVIVAGSAAEYGALSVRRLIREDDPAQAADGYGLVKRIQTAVALAQAGEDVVVARLFNILGPGLPPTMAGGRFAQEIVALERDHTRRDLSVGNLGAVRDFLDVRDICAALWALARRGRCGEIYHVCSGHGVMMRSVLARMMTLSRRKDLRLLEDTAGPAGVPYAVGSCARLRRETDWRPRYSLDQSIRATLEYYRRNNKRL